jgi:hypothetical protein
MSFRLEMLQVARLAPQLLGDSAELVKNFVLSKLTASGGFSGKSAEPDLYYTVFGIEGLLALQADLPRDLILGWLAKFGDGTQLDFVHLCCLIRCQAALKNQTWLAQHGPAIAQRLAADHRTPCGGFHPVVKSSRGNAYGCLLAFAAYEDLGQHLPEPERLRSCLEGLRTGDGAWSNEPGLPIGLAPPTAAALTLYRRMSWAAPQEAPTWLLRCLSEQGGFLPFPMAPMPDLLTTAVVLHGLSGAGAHLAPLKELCLDYVDSLWSAEGGFHGNWTDHVLDVEYTYYGLLALGHLS